VKIIKNSKEAMHHIRVKLYPSYLSHKKGTYIAKTNNEEVLDIEKICSAIISRGEFTGKSETLADYVKLFLNETVNQLCGGFAVSTGFYTIYPSIGGTFDSVNDSRNKKKNPVGFKFRVLAPLRKLTESIEIDVTEVAEVNAYIDEYLDCDENQVNSVLIPGNLFTILGNKIKITGDNPECGVYFVPVDDPGGAIKATRIAENNNIRITGIVPAGVNANCRVEIRTQFNGSAITLQRAPYIIKSDFILEAA